MCARIGPMPQFPAARFQLPTSADLFRHVRLAGRAQRDQPSRDPGLDCARDLRDRVPSTSTRVDHYRDGGLIDCARARGEPGAYGARYDPDHEVRGAVRLTAFYALATLVSPGRSHPVHPPTTATPPAWT